MPLPILPLHPLSQSTLIPLPTPNPTPPPRPAGNINTILNPPNAERTSTYSSHYNSTTRTMQTAGTTNKRPVPYSVNAFRNRLKSEEFKARPAGKSDISFDMGVVNKSIHPYRTIKQASEAPTVKPMEARRGFTNGHITAELSKKWHKTLWAQ